MDIFFTPTALVALATLVTLEVVLGIDNLIFIAILSEKLPVHQRQKARVAGLGLALVMRLILLSTISWVVSLQNPILEIFGHSFSWRDIILLLGGVFLLFKGTRELHERMEGASHELTSSKGFSSFGAVITQIAVLDAIFSIDAVITAVGMVNQLPIMIVAVVIAMVVMLLAANPLAKFVNSHPSVIILCLSFLLLIGLSLITEGFGLEIPKGYLYAAIGFSVVIEFFNQVFLHNERKYEKRKPMRLRTAEAVLRLLGSDAQLSTISSTEQTNNETPHKDDQPALFASEEVNMVTRVLTLSERTVRSIMTHRSESDFIDIDRPIEELRQQLLAGTPSVLPVCKGRLDNILGVAHAAELLSDIVRFGKIQKETIDEPHIVPESMRVIRLLEDLRSSRAHLVFVADEYGSIEGIITFMDVFEAIAGELYEDGEAPPVTTLAENKWRIAGSCDVHLLEHLLDIDDLVSESQDYTSLAGFLLAKLGSLPEAGDTLTYQSYRFIIEEVAERRITSVFVEKL